MDIRPSPLIVWPKHEDLYKTRSSKYMPKCFIDAFGLNIPTIIDCYEGLIDRPTNWLAKAQTFSSYNITLNEAWGGRPSDKFLT